MPKTKRAIAVPFDQISRSIVIIRGQRVLLDAELAALYGVTQNGSMNRSSAISSACRQISYSASTKQKRKA